MTTQNKITNNNLFKSVATTFTRFVAPASILALLSVNTASAQDRAITLNEAIKLGQQN
ncbi:MAG: hypothetical protein JWR02_1870, partial [Mucilaginibacter sp.]|nr:hypothetical protein [Mucilaginibacter sp.]